MTIQTTAQNRKDVVKAMREFCGQDSIYMGPPTFAYQVGEYTIDRDGAVTAETEDETLRAFLEERGLIAQEVEEIEVAIPNEGMTPQTWKHLFCLVHSKQYLLNRVVGANAFAVSDRLLRELEDHLPADTEGVYTLLAEYADQNKGLEVDAEQIRFRFPMQTEALKNTALTELLANMVQHAKTAKRVSSKLVMEDNEKYYLRTWLVRMGFSGAEAKEKRKVLLEGLHGHTAFRTPQDAEKWKAARRQEQAAKADEEEAEDAEEVQAE